MFCVCVPLTFDKMFVFFLHVPLRSEASDLTAVLHPENFWGHWWPLLLPSPAPVFLLLFFLLPLLPFLKLPSPRPLCLPALGLLLKPTERNHTVAGKGWSESACQHQTEDRRHKRTSEGERIKERGRHRGQQVERATTKLWEKQKQHSRCHADGKTQVSLEHHELARGQREQICNSRLVLRLVAHAHKSCGETHTPALWAPC